MTGGLSLLGTNPAAIIDQDPYHGLSVQPSAAREVKSAEIKVRPGVLKMLYKQRLGIPCGFQRVALLDVLARLPEVEMHLEEVGLGSGRTVDCFHVVGTDISLAESFSYLLIDNPDRVIGNRPAQALLDRHYEEMQTVPAEISRVFSVSPQRNIQAMRFLRSRTKKKSRWATATSWRVCSWRSGFPRSTHCSAP